MEIAQISALSPVDGRYWKQTESLSFYLSEAALINYRVFVEIEYFIALCEIPLPQLQDFDHSLFDSLRSVYRDFSVKEALEIKKIERTTNHDVKAVEYYIKRKFDEMALGRYKEFIHFGLTSQDINNTAIPVTVKLALEEVLEPSIAEMLKILLAKSREWKKIPMLARTHGQPASPTTLGKEVFVFVERIRNQLELLKKVPFTVKFGGATGNFNAHHVAYPEIDWVGFADGFTRSALGMKRQRATTQIEHYDNLAALFDSLKRLNIIFIDLCRDIWTYISLDYFKQKIREGEVGSSTMPHKVNPIDFENAEGNFGVANALFEHLSSKLPVSRLQRDLTDSTVTRNIGVPFGHTLIGLKSLIKGLNKLILNEEQLKKDLDNNWAVVAEAIQTILRRENYPNPYETLKKLTRSNTPIDREAIQRFISALKVSDEVKAELMNISPHNYTGINTI